MNMSEKPNTEQGELSTILTVQKKAFISDPNPSAKVRIAQLSSLKNALLSFQEDLVRALNQDYGQRPKQDTLVADILPCVMNINYTIKRLNKWMKPQRRHAGLLLAPAKVEVHYQPVGVVGIMVPWNFPVMLSIGPLITALAAGNRAMIKLSEFTPRTNQVIKEMLNSIFEEDTVVCIEGEVNIATEFSSLPFDHLIFTGSTTVGRHVMRAAANNLTPVTLELGGKSPVIIAPDMPIETAVERLIFGKCLNAGQICVAPDYILCPKDKVEAFISSYQKQFKKMYGNNAEGSDYAHVINSNQHSRLLSWLDDATSKGAKVVPANGQQIDRNSHALATQLVTETTGDMIIMQQEIFGPILPIISYEKISEAVEYINQRARPLALYIMSFDKITQQKLLSQTHSGGACINETAFHVAADDAPFGGTGDSGMGQYHGHEGFLTFSNARTVLSRGKFNIGKFIYPPYGGLLQRMMLKFFLR